MSSAADNRSAGVISEAAAARIRELSRKNGLVIRSVYDPAFRAYGRVIGGVETDRLLSFLETQTDIPAEGNLYASSVPELEALPQTARLADAVFGAMPWEAGYCNGRNTTLNGFEYHKSSEINVCASDLLLALGHCYDIAEDLTYDSAAAEIFFLERGTVIEMFGTTLHLSPLRVSDEGFRAVVMLPLGTNTPLTEEEKRRRDKRIAQGDRESRLLLHRNKWILAHPDREPLIRQGAYPGMLGENRELLY